MHNQIIVTFYGLPDYIFYVTKAQSINYAQKVHKSTVCAFMQYI